MVTDLEAGLILLAVFITITLSCAVLYVYWWRKKFSQEHAIDLAPTNPHTTVSSKELMYFLYCWDRNNHHHNNQFPAVGVPLVNSAKETSVYMFSPRKEEVANLVRTDGPPLQQLPPPIRSAPSSMAQVSAGIDFVSVFGLDESGTLKTIQENPVTDDRKNSPYPQKPTRSVHRYPSAELTFNITPGTSPPFYTPMSTPPRSH